MKTKTEVYNFSHHFEYAFLGNNHDSKNVILNNIFLCADWDIKLKGICFAPELCEWVKEEVIERILWTHPNYNLCNNAIVIGYPYGDTSMRAKLADISYVTEMFPFANIDYVPSFTNVFDGRMDVVKSELQAARAMAERQLRLIVEVGMFKNRKEYTKLYDLISLAEDCGFDVIKSSTGTYKNDVSAEEKLELISKTSLKKKVSGGINSVDVALNLIDRGADILGSSSAIDLIFKYMQS